MLSVLSGPTVTELETPEKDPDPLHFVGIWRQMRTSTALTTLSLTFPMKKQCQQLGDFISKSKSYALPCPSCFPDRFMSPSQRVVMEDGYTVLFRAGHTKARDRDEYDESILFLEDPVQITAGFLILFR